MKFTRFKNLCLFGGVSREEYYLARPMINRSNLRIWKISSIFFEILFLIVFGLSLIFSFALKDASLADLFKSYLIPFGVLSAYMILFVLVINLSMKHYSKALLPLIYITNAVILCSIGSISIFFDDTVSGAAFVAILVGLTFFTIDRPIRYSLFSFVIGLIYVLLCAFVKDASNDIIIRDVLLGSAFTVVSIFISFVLNTNRIKHNADMYFMELQRDTDPLTGVKNSNAYDRKVEEMKNKIKEHDNVKFAIAIFDINDLKIVNDNYGHSAGDKLIIRAAHLICDSFKHSPVYRIGGDEFVAIIENYDYQNREVIVRELHERIARIHEVSTSRNSDTSVAFGVAVYNSNIDRDYISVFSRADKQMYDNKRLLKQNCKYKD